MFIGSINQDLRAILNEMAPNWTDRPVYVGCSGNFTVERILAKAGVKEIHGNDVSLYSCALGWYLTGRNTGVNIKVPEYNWLAKYMTNGIGVIATLMLCGEMFKYVDRPEPFHRRMFKAYKDRFDGMHSETAKKVAKALEEVRLESFYAGDVINFMLDAPQDCVAVSFPPTYCLAPHHRILTADLRWVPCGNLKEGDRILAFDEMPKDGNRCRRWRFATVTRSQPEQKECVRVILENGDYIVCTTDHPWLSNRHKNYGPCVLKPLSTWDTATSYDAGWLAGIFDGEGSLSLANRAKPGHEVLAMNFIQKLGAVADRASELLKGSGLDFSIRQRPGGTLAFEIHGGVPSVMRTLGTLRPVRLLEKWLQLEIERLSVRTQQQARIKVLAVETVGIQEVQSISTSTGTYVGEGYLMHNTGGYERIYKKFDEVFEWERPDYVIFDDQRFELFTTILTSKKTWVTLRDKPVERFKDNLRGVVQTGLRSKPVYIYAGEGKTRLTQARQKTEPVNIKRLEGEITGPLSLIKLTIGQMNTLRSEYLATGIVPAAPQISLGVVAGDRLIGATGFSAAKYGDINDVYMMSDFAVPQKVYKRLSKLVLIAAASKEVQAILQQAFNRKVKDIYTTAFTDKAVSMKYRGIFEVYNRKDGFINYVSEAGRWTLAEGLETWKKKHSQRLSG